MRDKSGHIRILLINIAVAAVLAVVTYRISASFDIFERVVAFIEKNEKYEFDEIIIIIIVLSVFLTVNLFLQRRKLNKQNEIINNMLDEKELLLREIHHRIKNNINLLLGFLVLDKEAFDTDQTRNVYNRIVSKLHSMDLLYKDLSPSAGEQFMQAELYFESFFDRLKEVYSDGRIVHQLEVDDIPILQENLSILSIMINELYTNTVKYAFDGQETCLIEFKLEKKGPVIEITYSDNGVGYDDSEAIEGFGSVLFQSLSHQLEAVIEKDSSNGNRFKITVPGNL